MLVEMRNKGGRLCQSAKEGRTRCPLLVRPTSEDVITGHLFSTLKCLNPTYWLPDLLDQGLGHQRFHRQIFRGLEIEVWVKQCGIPNWLVPWTEGQTEIDVVITWNNPPVTVFIEMKYKSPVATKTVHSDGKGEYPADQIIRSVRAGLWKCGYYRQEKLLEETPTQFLTLLIAPKLGNRHVQRYRTDAGVRSALPNASMLQDLPMSPFVGEVSYENIVAILRKNRRFFSRAERKLADELCTYLEFKCNKLK